MKACVRHERPSKAHEVGGSSSSGSLLLLTGASECVSRANKHTNMLIGAIEETNGSNRRRVVRNDDLENRSKLVQRQLPSVDIRPDQALKKEEPCPLCHARRSD